ncbi:MAG: hypothetical protein IT385_15680 [Deltaproteobacteria bacterium]|nr:hypothetical protein [Deltaproteobacteria bacterium]
MLTRFAVSLVCSIAWACSGKAPPAPPTTAPTASATGATGATGTTFATGATGATGTTTAAPAGDATVAAAPVDVRAWLAEQKLPAVTSDGATIVHEDARVEGEATILELVWRPLDGGEVAERVTLLAPGALTPDLAALGARLSALTPLTGVERREHAYDDQGRPNLRVWLDTERLIVEHGRYQLLGAKDPRWARTTTPCEAEPELGGVWFIEAPRVLVVRIDRKGDACAPPSRYELVPLPAVPAAPPEIAGPHFIAPPFLPGSEEVAEHSFAGWIEGKGFPAISEDGRTIVSYEGTQDWREPPSLRVYWREVARDHEAGVDTLLSIEDTPEAVVTPELVGTVAARVEAMNQKLAAKRWTSLTELGQLTEEVDGEAEMTGLFGGGDPEVRVQVVDSKLTVKLGGKTVFAKVDERWQDHVIPECGDPEDESGAGWHQACGCPFEARVDAAWWSAEHRTLWLRIDSLGFHHCDTPHHYVALALPKK